MLIKLLITYEILFINLYLTYILVERKHSKLITFGVLFLFTFVLSVILYFTSPLFSGENPTIGFVVIGAVYLVPISLLYNVNFKRLIIIMVYCWTYTMIIGAIAFGIASLIDESNSILITLLIQTALLLITIKFIISFTKTKFITILNNSSYKTQNLLLLLGTSLFATSTVIRYYVNPVEAIYLILIAFLFVIIIASYNLLFIIVQSNTSLSSIEKIVFHDNLTGIANRYSLFKDMNELIASNKEFKLLFLDLDKLKNVNDTLGHNRGDEYLKHFANTLVNHIQDQGRAYRFAGDEFVCILTKGSKAIDVKDFEHEINLGLDKDFQFNGVSIGESEYPKDGETADILLHVADSNMYGVKRRKKIRAIK